MRQCILKILARLKCLISYFIPRSRNGYLLGMFFVFIFAFGMLFFAEPAGAIFQELFNAIIRGIIWVMLTVAQLSIAFTIFCLRFFITLASYNNYIDVDVVMLGWVMVRDVANMFFVVALLIMAFATILGLEQYEWKKELVKLIIAAIFINFSNLICQVIIDVAHVFTMTFLNAVSAAAGGNLINMFKMREVLEMARGGDIPTGPSGFDLDLLAAGMVAMAFAIASAVAMGAYVIVMVIRVTVLWALIILSPLAYILQVLPKTQEYSKKWWSMFGKQVIVAPVMVFFLWLSFATLGLGDVAQKIQTQETIPLVQTSTNIANSGVFQSPEPMLSLSKVSSWENMASFIIALIFMMIGIKVTQETGEVGAGIVGSAVNFGKKAATIASGYAAGRWLVGKGEEGVKGGLKLAAKRMPVIGGRNWSRLGKRIGERIKETPYLRHIPFIGVGGEYHEKLDKRVADRAEKNKKARLAELSYADEMVKKVPLVGDVYSKFFGLRESSRLKRKAEAREDTAMGQKEYKTGMKKARTETKTREWGRLHIVAVTKKSADEWAEDNHRKFDSDEEKVEAFNGALTKDSGLRRKFEKDLQKPLKVGELEIPDLETGVMKKASLDETAIARSAALQTYMEREKETYTAKAKQVKGEEDTTYLQTGLGMARFADMVGAKLGSFGEEEIAHLDNEEQQKILIKKRDTLRKLVLKIEDQDTEGLNLETFLHDPIVRAIYAAEAKGWSSRGQMKVDKEFHSNVSAAFIDPNITGKAIASDAGTQAVEQLKPTYSQLTEAERGDALTSNHILAALRMVLDKKATETQKIASAAIFLSAAENGNVDDGAAMNSVNMDLVDDYDRLSDEEKSDKNLTRKVLGEKGYADSVIDKILDEEQLAGFRKNYEIAKYFKWVERKAAVKDGVVQKDEDGKTMYEWSDRTDDEAMLTYATYSLTGGDEEYTRHSFEIGKIMEAEGIEFMQAAEIFYDPKNKNLREGDEMKSFEDWNLANETHQDIFGGFTETLKKLARATGHTQYHSNHVYDKSLGGKLRMAGLKESLKDKGSAIKKNTVNHTCQGISHYDDRNQEPVEFFEDKAKNLSVAKATMMSQVSGKTDERFQNTGFLWGNRDMKLTADDKGYATFLSREKISEGGNLDTLLRRGYGDTELGTYLQMLKVGAGELEAYAVPMALTVASRTGQDEIQAKKGNVKIRVDGTDIESDNIIDFMRQVADYLTGDKAEKAIKALEAEKTDTEDEVVKAQIDYDIGLIRKAQQNEGVVRKLRSRAGQGLADTGTAPVVGAQAMAEQVTGAKQAVQKSENVDNAADEFIKGPVQDVESPEERKRITEGVEQARKMAKSGDTDGLDRLATNISAGFETFNEGLKAALQRGFGDMVTSIKENAIKLDTGSLIASLEQSRGKVQDSKLQTKIGKTVGELKNVSASGERKDAAVTSLRTSAVELEDLQIRRQTMLLIKKLIQAKNNDEVETTSNEIEININNGAGSKNPELANRMKSQLGDIKKEVLSSNLGKLLNEVEKVQNEVIQKIKEREEAEQVLLDSDSEKS